MTDNILNAQLRNYVNRHNNSPLGPLKVPISINKRRNDIHLVLRVLLMPCRFLPSVDIDEIGRFPRRRVRRPLLGIHDLRKKKRRGNWTRRMLWRQCLQVFGLSAPSRSLATQPMIPVSRFRPLRRNLNGRPLALVFLFLPMRRN